VFSHDVIDAGAHKITTRTRSAGNSSNAQAHSKAAPKTALEASKLALNALGSASGFLPHGAVLSAAIKGVLMAVEVVEVSCTIYILGIRLT
jgi:hypothetical protein